jgi:hypothetical protein
MTLEEAARALEYFQLRPFHVNFYHTGRWKSFREPID